MTTTIVSIEGTLSDRATGWTPSRATVWTAAGWTDDEAHTLHAAGITIADARPWVDTDADADEIVRCVLAGVRSLPVPAIACRRWRYGYGDDAA